MRAFASLLAPIAVIALLAGCAGTPRFQNKACEQQFADCTDACADRCEPVGPADDTRRPPTLDDNDIGAADCAACVTACQRQADRCEGAPPPVEE